MKEDPDKVKRMRSKNVEGEEEESPASPVNDVSFCSSSPSLKPLEW